MESTMRWFSSSESDWNGAQAHQSGHDGCAARELVSTWGKGVGMLREGEATIVDL
jgi:hypothetical protein